MSRPISAPSHAKRELPNGAGPEGPALLRGGRRFAEAAPTVDRRRPAHRSCGNTPDTRQDGLKRAPALHRGAGPPTGHATLDRSNDSPEPRTCDNEEACKEKRYRMENLTLSR